MVQTHYQIPITYRRNRISKQTRANAKSRMFLLPFIVQGNYGNILMATFFQNFHNHMVIISCPACASRLWLHKRNLIRRIPAPIQFLQYLPYDKDTRITVIMVDMPEGFFFEMRAALHYRKTIPASLKCRLQKGGMILQHFGQKDGMGFFHGFGKGYSHKF